MSETRPPGRKPQGQRYFVPELKAEIKVEYLSTNRYLAHFPEGVEKVRSAKMKKEAWEYKGKWEDGER